MNRPLPARIRAHLPVEGDISIAELLVALAGDPEDAAAPAAYDAVQQAVSVMKSRGLAEGTVRGSSGRPARYRRGRDPVWEYRTDIPVKEKRASPRRFATEEERRQAHNARERARNARRRAARGARPIAEIRAAWAAKRAAREAERAARKPRRTFATEEERREAKREYERNRSRGRNRAKKSVKAKPQSPELPRKRKSRAQTIRDEGTAADRRLAERQAGLAKLAAYASAAPAPALVAAEPDGAALMAAFRARGGVIEVLPIGHVSEASRFKRLTPIT